jgi:hypothetical protein
MASGLLFWSAHMSVWEKRQALLGELESNQGLCRRVLALRPDFGRLVFPIDLWDTACESRAVAEGSLIHGRQEELRWLNQACQRMNVAVAGVREASLGGDTLGKASYWEALSGTAAAYLERSEGLKKALNGPR